MKDSGVAWIGEIPDDWACEKLKFHANIRNENIIDASDLDYIALENIESFSGKFIPSESQYDILQSKMAYAGDVLFGKLRPYLAKIYLLPKNAAVSAEFLVLSAVTVNKVYLKWYLLSSGFIDIVNASTYGTKMPRANADFIKNCVIPLPSSNKQQMIADFLDKKCAEIDCLIAHEETMIDELKAYKQSVITEAVTKGLDRSVPMKDSGVEWIGEIPIHWNHEKLKFHIKIRNDNIIDASDLDYIALENIESFSGKFISSENQYDILQSKMANADDVLFGKLRPYLAKVYLLPKNAAVSAEFLVLSAISVNKIYLKWYLLSFGFIDIVNASTYGAKMPRANADFIKNCTLLLPPTDEQQQIAEYLDRKCGEIDRLISLKQEKIEELRDYKKSLIYEYVTGKKEVV